MSENSKRNYKDYETSLVENAGSLGIGGEMLESLKKAFVGKEKKAEEQIQFTKEHAAKIIARGIGLRSSKKNLLANEREQGIRGDVLAIYNLGKYANSDLDYWDLQEAVVKGEEKLESFDLDAYLKAIKSHLQYSLAGDIGIDFKQTDTFGYLFSDTDRLLDLLPAVHLLEFGEFPSIPYDLDRYFDLGKLGNDHFTRPDQIIFTAQLNKTDLDGLWKKLKNQLNNVQLVDNSNENKYWAQDLLFSSLIDIYIAKLAAFLESVAMPSY